MAQNAESPFEKPEEAPEFYVDSVHVETQLYGSTLDLGNLRPSAPPLIKVVVKLSPPMLKVLSLVLSKHVRTYEQHIGTIPVPSTVLEELGLTEEK